MKKLKNQTLTQYVNILSQKVPVPGGGSAAALNGALGVALIEMVANYSLGRSPSKRVENRIRKIIEKSGVIRERLLELVDLDAEAYLKVVKTRKASAKEKKAALKEACNVPKEVGALCQKAMGLTSFLVEHGNKYLVSDIEVAIEILFAAFKAAHINIKVNQS